MASPMPRGTNTTPTEIVSSNFTVASPLTPWNFSWMSPAGTPVIVNWPVRLTETVMFVPTTDTVIPPPVESAERADTEPPSTVP